MAAAWKGCFALAEKSVVSNAMSFMSIIIDTILLQGLITSARSVTLTGHHETTDVAVTIGYVKRNLKNRRSVGVMEASASKGKFDLLLYSGNKQQNQLNRNCSIIQNFKVVQFLPYLNLKICSSPSPTGKSVMFCFRYS